MRVPGAGTPQSKLPPIHQRRRRSQQKKNLRSPGKARAPLRSRPACLEGYRRLSGNPLTPNRSAKACASSGLVKQSSTSHSHRGTRSTWPVAALRKRRSLSRRRATAEAGGYVWVITKDRANGRRCRLVPRKCRRKLKLCVPGSIRMLRSHLIAILHISFIRRCFNRLKGSLLQKKQRSDCRLS